jgi:SsrA-binding protein
MGKLQEKVQQKGYTIVPVKMYLSKGRAKLEIALAKGKKQYDKRQTIAERDSQREIERALRAR